MRLPPDRLDPVARERASVEEDIAPWRHLTPAQRLEHLAALLAALTPVAMASPHWERFSANEPMPPDAAARWARLVGRERR